MPRIFYLDKMIINLKQKEMLKWVLYFLRSLQERNHLIKIFNLTV